jgi:hypothetical protein
VQGQAAAHLLSQASFSRIASSALNWPLPAPIVSLPRVADDKFEEEPREESSEDDEGLELAPEEQEALRKTADEIRSSLAPKIHFELPSMAKLIPNSALKNIPALSAFVETQQAIVNNAIKPFLDSRSAWQKTFSVINSDIASQLTKNIDFGLSETMPKVASQWLKAIAPSFANFKARFYPLNLQDIEGLRFKQVKEVVMDDGIPLYGLRRTSTAEALIRADSASKRRDILGRRWQTISADCREVITACTTAVVAPYAPFAVAALDALDTGHTEAAQALAGSLIDAILSAWFEEDRSKFTPDRKGTRTTDAYNEFTVREFIAFAPMWQTYQQFWVKDGDVVPTTFSRNATAHTVNRRQYNRRNAVQALMVACSLLCRIDEEATLKAA